jgi:hypothetical protein
VEEGRGGVAGVWRGKGEQVHGLGEKACGLVAGEARKEREKEGEEKKEERKRRKGKRERERLEKRKEKKWEREEKEKERKGERRVGAGCGGDRGRSATRARDSRVARERNRAGANLGGRSRVGDKPSSDAERAAIRLGLGF